MSIDSTSCASRESKIKLSPAEITAKNFFIKLYTKGIQNPCTLPPKNYGLPSWYDPNKFKCGQKFFRDNSLGILVSNVLSVVSFLSIPKGLKILIATGKSNTPEKARKRYKETLMETLLWYKTDLKPGSKSFESLRRVRIGHYYASEKVKSKGISPINVTDISVTAFGFLGLALTRPHLLAVNHKDRDGQEGFIHMWAVFCYLLGVEDEFNMCLLPFDAVIVFCQMYTRYILIPLVQIERPDFRRMVKAFTKGMEHYSPSFSFEATMFMAKRLLEIPGYQHEVDVSKEVLCRSIISQKELNYCTEMIRKYDSSHEFFLTYDIPLFEVFCDELHANSDEDSKKFGINVVIGDKQNSITTQDIEELRRRMMLSSNERLIIKFIRYEEDWLSNITDARYWKMVKRDQRKYNINQGVLRIYDNKIARFFLGRILNFILSRI